MKNINYKNLYKGLVKHIKELDFKNQEQFKKDPLNEYCLGKIGTTQEILRTLSIVEDLINEIE